VMVEASFNANMPFKWNAVSVQLVAGLQVGVGVISREFSHLLSSFSLSTALQWHIKPFRRVV